MKIKHLLIKAAVALLLAVLPLTTAQADPVLTLSTPSQAGFPGSTVNFFGTISNSGDSPITVDLIFASLIAPPEAFTVDVSPFFLSTGYAAAGSELVGHRLGAGANTGEILLFSVNVDPLARLILDFAFPGDVFVTDTNGTQSNVAAYTAAATVPEPTTMVLLSTGLAGAAALRRRRRKNNQHVR